MLSKLWYSKLYKGALPFQLTMVTEGSVVTLISVGVSHPVAKLQVALQALNFVLVYFVLTLA